MEQLLAFIQQQQKTINTLQQQLLAIQIATITAATPAPAPVLVMVPIPEVASPPKFNGERVT